MGSSPRRGNFTICQKYPTIPLTQSTALPSIVIEFITLSEALEQLADPCRPKVAKKSDIVLPCGTEMEKVQFVAPLILYG